MDIVDRFIQQVDKNPSAISIIDRHKEISYIQFYETVNRLAGFVNEFDIAHPKVMIDMRQGIDAYSAMYATLMIGGYYCPVNYDLPVDRKQQIFDLFSPDVVISHFEQSLQYQNCIRINPKDVPDVTQAVINTAKHELAYVIFTSGSTGIPKGVMIRRKSVSKFIEWAVKAIKPQVSDRWAQFSNLGFDLSVMDIYAALGSGATLVPINTQRYRLNPARAIRQHEITIWHSVPSVIDLMDRTGEITSENLNSLRLMSFCGEPLRPQHLKKLFDANQEMIVFNTYGPTEGTVFFTWIPLNKDNYFTKCDNFSVALGEPIPGWQWKIVETEHESHEGELVIYGDYIGAGYWQDPDRTAESFRMIEIKGELYPAYYTGDLVYRKENNIYFQRRVDRQVKVHGFRIELGEIESAIRDYGISNCRVIHQNEMIYAFIEGKANIVIDDLRSYLSLKLPHYEVPSKILLLDQLPRNYNDKTDISSLLKMIGKRDDEQEKI